MLSKRKETANFCPNCGAQRKSGGRFCEKCRYDFDPSDTSPATAAEPENRPPPSRLEAVVTVDPELFAKSNPSAPLPDAFETHVYPLTFADMTICRKRDTPAEPNAIPVADPGASSRQTRIVRLATGEYEIQDLGSSNGTTLNGARLVPGIVAPIKAGDLVTVGCWTRIVLQPHVK